MFHCFQFRVPFQSPVLLNFYLNNLHKISLRLSEGPAWKGLSLYMHKMTPNMPVPLVYIIKYIYFFNKVEDKLNIFLIFSQSKITTLAASIQFVYLNNLHKTSLRLSEGPAWKGLFLYMRKMTPNMPVPLVYIIIKTIFFNKVG